MEENTKTLKKKILLLLEAFDKGGIEQVTLDIVNNLDPEKYDITIQTFWYGGHCQSLVNPNIKVIPFFFKRYIKGIIRLLEYLSPKLLYRIFVHGDYDVEIAASDGGAAKVISGSTNKKARKICWVHMDVINQGSKLRVYKEKKTSDTIYLKFDKIICVSRNAEKQFNKKFGCEEKTVTVHNPIPVNTIRRKAIMPCEIEFSQDYFNIVSVGSLLPVKGFDRLIRVCGRLATEDNLPIRLYIIGSGIEYENLKRIIYDSNFSNIKLCGFYANPYPFMKNADLYVCSSLSEAFSLVIGESFALETPVLGTRCSGVCEWMEEDNSGMIVENSEEALYEGIKKIVSDRDLLHDLTKQAKEKSLSLDFTVSFGFWENIFLQ